MSTINVYLVESSGTEFNTTACRYVKETMKMVHPERVRAVVDDNIEAGIVRVGRPCAELVAAATSVRTAQTDHMDYVTAVRTWRDAMAHEVRAMHMAAAVSATGGFIQPDCSMGGPVDQRIGSLLKMQMMNLSNLAVEAAERPEFVLGQDGSVPTFESRARALAESARGTYEWMQYWTHHEAGFLSLENDATLCTTPCDGPGGCAEQSALGRVAIDDARFVIPGLRACGTACRCRTRYYRAAPNEPVPER